MRLDCLGLAALKFSGTQIQGTTGVYTATQFDVNSAGTDGLGKEGKVKRV